MGRWSCQTLDIYVCVDHKLIFVGILNISKWTRANADDVNGNFQLSQTCHCFWSKLRRFKSKTSKRHKLFLEAQYHPLQSPATVRQRLARPGPQQRPVWIHRVLAASSQCFPFPLLHLQGNMCGISVSWHRHTRQDGEKTFAGWNIWVLPPTGNGLWQAVAQCRHQESCAK